MINGYFLLLLPRLWRCVPTEPRFAQHVELSSGVGRQTQTPLQDTIVLAALQRTVSNLCQTCLYTYAVASDGQRLEPRARVPEDATFNATRSDRDDHLEKRSRCPSPSRPRRERSPCTGGGKKRGSLHVWVMTKKQRRTEQEAGGRR